MEKTFKYTLDRHCKRITIGVIVFVGLILGGLTYLYFDQGAYFPAWFLSLVIAVLALYILSIPRSIHLSEEAIEIHCVLELTRIPIVDLKSIKNISNRRTGFWLLLGSYGFFGYYGYYFDWRQWQIIKMYASQWKGLVEIEDIYEQRYIVSCRRSDELIRAVTHLKETHDSQHPHQSINY